MTAAELFHELLARDVDIWREGDRLRFRAPTGAMTAVLRAQVAAQRHELLALAPYVGAGDGPLGLTAAEIAGFRRLGVAAKLGSTAAGEFWVVPAYTDVDRREVTAADAGKLLALLHAFPGSAVDHFAWLRSPSTP